MTLEVMEVVWVPPASYPTPRVALPPLLDKFPPPPFQVKLVVQSGGVVPSGQLPPPPFQVKLVVRSGGVVPSGQLPPPPFQVKLVVQSGGVVPSGQLLSLTISMDKKLSHGAAQEFLKARVKDHWLAEVSSQLW